ncbi:unnamed protein product [Bursaphelenchus xylophilus]|uniref:(pine wood nematode) hypothetical protein n=1 Tax=Bursaphelenchus xylophilus TaxID=6326 RepID=A0A1I7S1G9_BURXY|nr:unnamed protein product [Bursaphelenchus xylophilus]CAG9081509.1 unnamed protein product [Bursaphelenchus xylophilus]
MVSIKEYVEFVLVIIALIDEVNSLPTAKNCEDLLHVGYKDNGIYEISTFQGPRSVYCDQISDGGGWTVIQQRFNGTVQFWSARWEEYANGFGELGEDTEFWAGNELIHELTAQCRNMSRLRVVLFGDRSPMSQDDGQLYVGNYLFKIDSASQLYTIHIKYDKNLPNNATTGWYDLTLADLNPFSTVDRIHDPEPYCLRQYRMGGWWTKNCGVTSLNGEYNPREYGKGFGLFFMLKGQRVIHPRTTQMMIRCNDG